VIEADLILHVVDVSDPNYLEKRKVVLDVLQEIGAGDHPRFTVYNKADLLKADDPLPLLKSNEYIASAVTGEGLDALVEDIVSEVAIPIGL
jgi:GTP-binding protein HflX